LLFFLPIARILSTIPDVSVHFSSNIIFPTKTGIGFAR
jgi:hypothetical protein